MTDIPLQKHRRSTGRPFVKGASGNPKGRPPGTRNRATLLAENILSADIEDVVRVIVEKAKEGDMQAAKLILSRIVPPVRDRPIQIALPSIETNTDARSAIGALLSSVCAGTTSPSEALDISRLIDMSLKAIELKELSERIEAIEMATRRRK